MDARGPSPLSRVDARPSPPPVVPSSPAVDRDEFKRALRQAQAPAVDAGANVTFSAHAQERLRTRNIALSQDDVRNIGAAMDRVAQKGGRQALFLMKTAGGRETSMVVSVRNRVVITAVDGESLKENIFTNIDSAAII